MLNFTRFDAGGQGPFGPEARFGFHDGLNVIEGDNGSGKTTLFNLLQERLQAAAAAQGVAVPACLTGIGEGDWYRGRREAPLPFTPLLAASSLDRARLGRDMTRCFRRIIHFHGGPGGRYANLHFTISAAGEVSLRRHHRPVDDAGFAATEQVCRHLALVRALRAQLPGGREWPLIVDCLLGSLDRLHTERVGRLLRGMAPQVIALVSPRDQEAPGWRADYRLERGEGADALTRVQPFRSMAPP